MDTYRIIRMYQLPDVENRVIRSGLTLAQAQEHCRDKETSSRTAQSAEARRETLSCGAWFDGYERER